MVASLASVLCLMASQTSVPVSEGVRTDLPIKCNGIL